jgi:sRNA-binding carbon storage regulator CsrA
MGKLVLTRRAGEGVKLTEPNGDVWVIRVEQVGAFIQQRIIGILVRPNGDEILHLGEKESRSFAGGNVELRQHKRPDQAILAFDFPRDVNIVRTEIA